VVAHVAWGTLFSVSTAAVLTPMNLPVDLVLGAVVAGPVLAGALGTWRAHRSLRKRRRALAGVRGPADSGESPHPSELVDTNELPAFSAAALYRRHSH
jgi:hypothetical protein